MDQVTKAQNMIKGELNIMYAAVNYFQELEGQDIQLTLEMSQAMLNDILENGSLLPMIEYVKRYCDVADSADEYQTIADDI